MKDLDEKQWAEKFGSYLEDLFSYDKISVTLLSLPLKSLPEQPLPWCLLVAPCELLKKSTWVYLTCNHCISELNYNTGWAPEVGTELDGAVFEQEKSLPQFCNMIKIYFIIKTQSFSIVHNVNNKCLPQVFGGYETPKL